MPYVYRKPREADSPINFVLPLAIIVGGLYAWKEGWFDEIINVYKQKGQEAIDNFKKNAPEIDLTPPGLRDGGGGGSGSGPYKLTGRKCSGSSGSQTIGCGGGSSPSLRVNFNNCGIVNYEATARLQFGGGCGCGDEATVKHYGPSHSDGNCCWALSAVMQNGDCCFGGEGPHPSTTKCQQKLGNIGSLKGKIVGIKSIIIKTSGGAHQELYVDPSGSMNNWRKMGSRDISSWGDSKKSSSVSSNQQVEFRVDCSGAKWLSYDVSEIAPSSASFATAGAAFTGPVDMNQVIAFQNRL